MTLTGKELIAFNKRKKTEALARSNELKKNIAAKNRSLATGANIPSQAKELDSGLSTTENKNNFNNDSTVEFNSKTSQVNTSRNAETPASLKTSDHGVKPKTDKNDSFSENTTDNLSNKGEEPPVISDDATIDFGINIEDNPINSLENPAYNIKFFMTRENATHDTLNYEDAIVIAETGSTGYNITDLTMNHIAGPLNRDARNTTATTFSFTIIEPHGNTMFDRIRNAARVLGVHDHRVVPMWIQVSFKGYTGADRDSYGGGKLTTLKEETRTWQISIRDVNVEIDSGGAVYSFDNAVVLGHDALADKARKIEKQIEIEAKTLKDFFESLAIKLNEQSNFSLEGVKDNAGRIRNYAFALPVDKYPNMLDWVIRGQNKSSVKRSEDTTKPGFWRTSWPANTTIESIIEEIIGTTVEGQQLAIYGELAGNVENINAKSFRNPIKPSVVFITEPTVDIVSYNQIAKQYNVLLTYNVRPYITFIPLISRLQLEKINDKENNRARLKNMIKLSNMKKKYDYMFTGLNTEVLDYKIKFNRAWFYQLPLFVGNNRASVSRSGTNLSREANEYVQTVQETQREELSTVALIKKLTLEIEENESLLEQSATKLVRNNLAEQISQQKNELFRAQERVNLIDEKQRSLTRTGQRLSSTPLSTSPGISTTSFGADTLVRIDNNIVVPTNSQGSIDLLSSSIIGSDRAREDVILTKQQNINNDGSIFFVEDFNDITEQFDKLDDLKTPSNNNIRQTSTEIGPPTKNGTKHVEDTNSNGRSYYALVMSQLHGSQGQMQKVDIEIKGDPYWLGEPDYRKIVLGQSSLERDLTLNDNHIIFTVGFPNNIDDGGLEESIDGHAGTGFITPSRIENGFNGIYIVRRITSKFENGSFTQSLDCVVDPMTKELTTLELVNSIERLI